MTKKKLKLLQKCKKIVELKRGSFKNSHLYDIRNNKEEEEEEEGEEEEE